MIFSACYKAKEYSQGLIYSKIYCKTRCWSFFTVNSWEMCWWKSADSIVHDIGAPSSFILVITSFYILHALYDIHSRMLTRILEFFLFCLAK